MLSVKSIETPSKASPFINFLRTQHMKALTATEVNRHKRMKEKDPSYPKLPKIYLGKKRQNTGHTHSVTSGFLRRLSNWKFARGIVDPPVEAE